MSWKTAILLIVSFSFMSCDVEVGSTWGDKNPPPTDSDKAGDGDGGDGGEPGVPAFSHNLKLNEVAMDGFVLAYPTGRTSTGAQAYQLRFFSGYERAISYCDSSFTANENSDFDHVAMINVTDQLGKQDFHTRSSGWTAPGTGSMAKKPFNTFHYALGSYEVISADDIRVRGRVKANNNSNTMTLEGDFEAFLCTDKAEIALVEKLSKLLPEQGRVYVSRNENQHLVQLDLSSSGGKYELEMRALEDNAPEALYFSSRYMIAASGHILTSCYRGYQIWDLLGRITPTRLEYSSNDPSCFDYYNAPPKKLLLEQRGKKVYLEFTTQSDEVFTGTWDLPPNP